MTVDVNIYDWINYRPNVGVEGIHIIGLPGTGKTNQASLLAVYCMEKGEHIVMPGDRFCEWRHFLDYDCNVKVLIPKTKELELIGYVPEWLEDKEYIISTDYQKLDIFKYLETDPTVLAIYDACFGIADRAQLWVYVLRQLLNRNKFIDHAIALLFHEAGIYWPENARGEHWGAVEDFANLFVDCRKGLVRPILESQLQTEIYHLIRMKCMAAVHRKGFPSRRLPDPLQKVIPYTALNEFHFQYGGLYVRKNIIDKFQEKKILYKMVPRRYIDGDSLPHSSSEKNVRTNKECQICGHTWKSRVLNPKLCPSCKHMIKYDVKDVLA